MNENMIKKASEIIFANEGGYSSVNANDNGAVSIGRIQWHGTRALNLLKKIVNALGEESALSYISKELYIEITTSRSWSKRTVSEAEAHQLSAVLSCEQSVAEQDAQAEADVGSYIEHIESLGVTDEAALIFIADIENQGGAAASRRIIEAAEGTDIDSLYVAACNDDVFKNYIPRRARVYLKLTGHPFGEAAYEGVMHEVKYGDTLSHIAKEYGVSVKDIAELNNITNPDLIRTGDILKIPPQQSPTPAPEPDTTAPSDNDTERTYTVVAGDTLSGIGAKLDIPWREIADINGITSPFVIYKGQELKLPCENASALPLTHRVVRGDTLSALARQYNTTVSDILAVNRGKYRAISADYIVVGWELVMPGGVT